MIILAFSDTHLDQKEVKKIIRKAKKADILICAGDISWFGTGLEKILRTLNQIKKPLYIIQGNHEEGTPIARICKKFKHIHYVNKETRKIGEHNFFFWGGGGFALKDKKLEEAMKKFRLTLKKGEEVILVTHGPPHNTPLDYLEWAGHVGCKSQRKFIKVIKPILHISGHLHEHMYEQHLFDTTLLINAGPGGTLLQV